MKTGAQSGSPAAGDTLIAIINGVRTRIDIGNLPTGGGGEANTHSSVGGGLGLTAATPKVGVDLRLISLNALEFNVGSDVATIDPKLAKAWTGLHL